jgi:hypothetical protein
LKGFKAMHNVKSVEELHREDNDNRVMPPTANFRLLVPGVVEKGGTADTSINRSALVSAANHGAPTTVTIMDSQETAAQRSAPIVCGTPVSSHVRRSAVSARDAKSINVDMRDDDDDGDDADYKDNNDDNHSGDSPSLHRLARKRARAPSTTTTTTKVAKSKLTKPASATKRAPKRSSGAVVDRKQATLSTNKSVKFVCVYFVFTCVRVCLYRR